MMITRQPVPGNNLVHFPTSRVRFGYKLPNLDNNKGNGLIPNDPPSQGWSETQKKIGFWGAIVLGVATAIGGTNYLINKSNSGPIPANAPTTVAVAEKNIELAIASSGWAGRELTGEWNKSPLKITLERGWDDIRNITGTFNGTPLKITTDSSSIISGHINNHLINLAVKDADEWAVKTLTGNFMGKPVNIKIAYNWGDRYLSGTLGDQQVNLKCDGSSKSRRIYGNIGTESFDTVISSDNSSSNIIGGIQTKNPSPESTENLFMLNLILLNQARSSSSTPSSGFLDL